MLYSVIVQAYEKIDNTTKRTEITSALVDVFKRTDASMIDKVVYLTQGKLYPDYLGIEIGIAEKLAIRAISSVTGRTEEQVLTIYKKYGDIGTTAEKLVGPRTQSRLQTKPLTVDEVYQEFDKIARAVGSGSVNLKINRLSSLLINSTSTEAKYLSRMAVGRLRLGVADMTLLDALAESWAGNKKHRNVLEQAYNRCSDLGLVAKTLALHGTKAIEQFKVTIGRPVRPMLSERLSDPNAIIGRMEGEASAEYKYDGLRIQAHLSNNKVTLFSRRLENITDQFPDVQELVKKGVRSKTCIIEGEVVAVDPITSELLPFQLLSQRRGRKYELKETIEEIPVAAFPFDVLYNEGRDTTSLPYLKRREILRNIVTETNRFSLSKKKLVTTSTDLDGFMQQAITEGCEGVMVKSISADSFYQAGSRGWLWIKYKREYKSEMQDTADLVVVGAFIGRGRRGGYYGALLLASYDENSDTFQTVTKCGSGFTDEDLTKLPKMLEKYMTAHRNARVDSKLIADTWFIPGLVIEIIGAEITLSPIHTCAMNKIRQGSGLAIRFPRFTGRYRTEKSPEDSTSTKEITEMYQNQLKKIKTTTSTSLPSEKQ